MLNFEIDVIGISESKINKGINSFDISMNGYKE